MWEQELVYGPCKSHIVITPTSFPDLSSDVADAFPSAIVHGVDLSPIQPEWVPPNVIFEVDDVTLPWTFGPSSFDFVHIREMFGSVEDWDKLFYQAYQSLIPGGFMECEEHSVTPVSDDGTVGPDHVYTRYGALMNSLGMQRGKEFDVWSSLKERMQNAGFVDVVETRTKWPMNGWSSDPIISGNREVESAEGIARYRGVCAEDANVSGWCTFDS